MKFVEIPKCENLFPCGVFLFIAFICVILLFSNAYGESINVIGLGNFTIPENLSKSTKNYTLVDNVINSNITNQLTEKFVAQIKQIDEKKALIEVIPVSIERSLKNDSESPKSNLLYSDRNDTVKSTNTTEVLPPPPMVSYIENEGEQLKTINYVSKNSNINTSEEEDDESSRNTSEEEDDESSRNTSEEEDDESSRNTSEEEDDESSRNTSEEEDDESSRNTSEEEDDESSRNTSEESTGEIYYKKPNVLSTNELTGNKIIGNSIDNENNKLMSQFSELNSSIISNNQINAEEENSKINDKKPIANAGLDQVIKGDQNIVLDASSSFDPEGKISSYFWKQTGNSEDNINTSHSMIYSFPIPEGLEENILEFKLIVMDENGQKDIDTVKYLITDEYNDETET